MLLVAEIDQRVEAGHRFDPDIAALAARYQRANSGGVALISALGGSMESWLTRLPQPVRDGLDEATRAALSQSVKVAQATRTGRLQDPPDWVNSALGVALGAA
ncbi:MAG: protein EcsC, partial [Pseudomonadota bacterium]